MFAFHFYVLHSLLWDRPRFFNNTETHICNFAVPKANEVLYSWSSLLIGSDPSSSNGITSDRVPKIKSWSKKSKNLLTAKQFPAADILAATRDFNEECLIGEGFTGRVYRGDFSDGQVWYFDHKHTIIVAFCSSIIVCYLI
jgi:hypothetical protein